MTLAVDGFEIGEPIGSGGFSRVYRAEQVGFGREVALKVLTVGIESEAQRRAFERECRAMGALASHPSIVTVLSAAMTNDGRPCIAMEYFAGGTLADRLRADGPLPIASVLRAGIELSGALETAHQAGVFHRDIKPSNLFVSAFGTSALGDFGISSLDGERTITGGGGLTVHFAPPELIEGERCDERSDLYSLAASLFTLAQGDKPYPKGPGQTNADLARRILIAPTPRLGRADAPAAFADSLEQAMAKDPDARPQTAAEFGRVLQAIQRSLGLAVTPLITPDQSGDHPSEAPAAVADDAAVSTDDSSPAMRLSNRSGRRASAMAIGVLALIALVSTSIAVSSGAGRSDAAEVDAPPDAASASQLLDDEFFSPPMTPKRVAVEAIDDTTFSVSWQAAEPDDVDRSFEVEQIGGDATVVRVTESPVELDRAPGTAPCFVVRAVGVEGRLSADSEPVCAGD